MNIDQIPKNITPFVIRNKAQKAALSNYDIQVLRP